MLPPPAISSFFRRLCLGLFFLLALATTAQAQFSRTANGVTDQAATPHVQAQLVLHTPEGIAPGTPVQLGLLLRHQPQWHTYWKNAGDSGLPTTLDWQLPTGLTAADIAWPTPEQIRVGDLLNYGYAGQVLLPIPITVTDDFAPDSQGMVRIGLHASWLVCKVECIPEDVTLALHVPAAQSHAAFASEFEAASASQPSDLADFSAQFTVADDGEHLRLQVRGLPADVHGQALDFYPEDADTFRHADVLRSSTEQGWDGDTWQALQLPLSDMRGATPQALSFVLTPSGARSPAWRLTAPIHGQWQAAALAEISPALAAALAKNNAPAPTPVNSGSSAWLMAVLGGLLGGMLLNLMPCVFPVLAIKLLGFARHGDNLRAQRWGGMAYTVGAVLSFMALGGLLLGLRAAGEQLGWGFQLQNPLVVSGLALLFTVLGLNLAGVFEFGQLLPSRIASLQLRHPVADAFLSGILAVAVASPCTAPFMGASLGFAVALPTGQALGIFAALGLGMALPYLLLSWAPGLLRWLPRPGPWMATFRRAMAFPMLATVVWLTWVLGQQTGVDGIAALLALLLALSALIWALTLAGRTRWVLGAALLALCAWLLPTVSPYLQASAAATPAATDATWQPWSPERQEELLATNQRVFVDYTAAWCVTCQFNKRTTLSDPAVLDALAAHQVQLLRADWTRQDPRITAALAALGRSGVPVYVLLAPGQAPQVLTELIRPDDVLQALAKL